MQRGENPNQLLSGVVFTQNQSPQEETDFFDFETADWICQEFYFPSDYVRGIEDQANTPEFTGVQVFVSIAEGTRAAAGLDWVVQHYVPAVGWLTEAEGESVQSHAEGDEIWYDILFDEGIQPDTDSFNHRWRFCLRGRVGTGSVQEEVPYENNIVTVGETEVNVRLFPDRPHPFLLNGVPSLLVLKSENEKVYYSVQQGITALWTSRPNPLATINVAATTRDETPLLIEGEEVSLLFRLMSSVGDEGVDFLGNVYREAVRRNKTTNIDSTFGDEADTYWFSKPNPSRFAVESMYFDMRDSLGNSQVIDQVLVDPITPGVYFHVYFANEEILDSITRVNYIDNSHFATSDDLWTGVGLDTKERVTNQFYIANGSLHLDNNVQGNNYAYYRVTSSVTPGVQDQLDDLRGKTVTLSAWVRKDAAWVLNGGPDQTIGLSDGIPVAEDPYSVAVLEDSPGLLWMLDDAAGTFQDSTANNRDGTNAGAVTYAQTGLLVGDSATSVGLIGDNASRITSTYAPYTAGSTRTFEGVHYRNSSANEDRIFSGLGANSPLLTLPSGNQNVVFSPDISAAGGDVTWTNAWPGNAQAVHWALIFNDAANTVALYINGILVSVQTAAEPYGAAPGNFQLNGPSGGGSTNFDGRAQAFAIYEYALSAERILYHYQVSVQATRVVTSGSMSSLPHSTWERQSVTMTVDEAALELEARLYNGGVGDVWWDGVLLEEGLLNSWFQGTQYTPPAAPASIYDWEERIWQHVPKTFQMVKRDSHALPEPIQAKYVKIEFSHLQPRPYNAGDFAQPIAYKKHPRWVLDYFVARRELDQYGEGGSNFAPNRVGIRYDALDLAYNYYLDDLRQEPNEPVNLDSTQRDSFVSEFSQISSVDSADEDTLARIKLTFDQFKQHPALYNNAIYSIILNPTNYPTEYQDLPAQIYDVSALRNLHKEAIVYELTYPVMFFFVPCRHRYKEVTAALTYNRAYFAGVRQIAFSREKYGIANDTDLYIEGMGDGVNMDRMDFIRVAEGEYVTDVGENF